VVVVVVDVVEVVEVDPFATTPGGRVVVGGAAEGLTLHDVVNRPAKRTARSFRIVRRR
jgi:hypothetical protein